MRRLRSFVGDSRYSAWILLALILAVGLGFRVARAPQGLPYLYHWDEPQVASRALLMLKTGDLHPHFFNYGSFPIYLNLAVDTFHYLHLMGEDPEEVSPPLEDMEDLEIGIKSSWIWDVSHPSFYLWNRWLTSIFGALCVLGTFLVSRSVVGSAEALLAALVVATTSFHIGQSAWVTVDVPASCFALYAVWAALKYLEEHRSSWLLASVILASLAASAKYTAVLAVLIPLIALAMGLAQRREKWRPKLLLGVLALPPIVFLSVTPYAFLDFSQFIEDVGFELRHYKVSGHEGNTVEEGFGHLVLELTELAGNLGPVVCSFALLGFFVLLRSSRGRFLLVLPILHLLYMSRMVTHFHRNHVLLYPFAAVAAGVGAVWVFRRLRDVAPEKWRPWATSIGVLLLLLFAIPRTVKEWRTSRRIGVAKDSRTQMIDRIEKLSDEGVIDPGLLVFEAELRVHERDLETLSARPEILDLAGAACRKHGFLVLGDRHEAVNKVEEAIALDEIGDFARKHRATLASIDTGQVVHIERVFQKPALKILGPAEGELVWPYACRNSLSVRESRLKKASLDSVGVSLRPGGELLSPAIEVPAGRFSMVFSTAASFPNDEENPDIRMEAIALDSGGEEEVVAVLEASVVNRTEEQRPVFHNTVPRPLAFRLTFLAGDYQTRAQRTVWVHSIRLESRRDRASKSGSS